MALNKELIEGAVQILNGTEDAATISTGIAQSANSLTQAAYSEALLSGVQAVNSYVEFMRLAAKYTPYIGASVRKKKGDAFIFRT